MQDDENINQEGLKAAAEDLLQAIKNNDAAGLASALQSFFSMVDNDDEEEGPDEYDSEGGLVGSDDFFDGDLEDGGPQMRQSKRFGEREGF